MASSKQQRHKTSLHLSPLSSFSESLTPLSSFADSQVSAEFFLLPLPQPSLDSYSIKPQRHHHHNQLFQLFESATQPLSLGSEPPDVRNWFSSYEYESPSQDSFLPHFDLDSTGCEERVVGGEEGTAVPKSSPADASDAPHRLEALLPAEEIDPSGGGGDGEERRTSKLTGDSCPQTEEVKSIAVRAKPTPNDKDFPSEGYSNKIGQDKPYLRSDLTVQQCSLKRNCSEQSSEAKAYNPKYVLPKESRNLESNCPQANPEAQAMVPVEHQNGSCVGNSDGWVSTRSFEDRMGRESSRKTESILGVKENGNLNLEKSSSTVERSGATEDTKLNEVERQVERSLEIPGKWCCPGKRKLDLGSPLKQLGLERWVRRLV